MPTIVVVGSGAVSPSLAPAGTLLVSLDPAGTVCELSVGIDWKPSVGVVCKLSVGIDRKPSVGSNAGVVSETGATSRVLLSETAPSVTVKVKSPVSMVVGPLLFVIIGGVSSIFVSTDLLLDVSVGWVTVVLVVLVKVGRSVVVMVSLELSSVAEGSPLTAGPTMAVVLTASSVVSEVDFTLIAEGESSPSGVDPNTLLNISSSRAMVEGVRDQRGFNCSMD